MKVMARDRKTHRPALDRRPVFPGYAFARFDNERRGEVKRVVAYLIDFLRFGGGEAFVPAEEMGRIQLLLESPAPIYRRIGFVAGQRVRVKSGAMAGLEGVFVREMRERLIGVSMPLFGRTVLTPIDEELVEPVVKKCLEPVTGLAL